jgi:hypothetical protein
MVRLKSVDRAHVAVLSLKFTGQVGDAGKTVTMQSWGRTLSFLGILSLQSLLLRPSADWARPTYPMESRVYPEEMVVTFMKHHHSNKQTGVWPSNCAPQPGQDTCNLTITLGLNSVLPWARHILKYCFLQHCCLPREGNGSPRFRPLALLLCVPFCAPHIHSPKAWGSCCLNSHPPSGGPPLLGPGSFVLDLFFFWPIQFSMQTHFSFSASLAYDIKNLRL